MHRKNPEARSSVSDQSCVSTLTLKRSFAGSLERKSCYNLLVTREKSFSKMPPKAKANGEKKARAPPKRKLAEEFPPGEVLTDNAKKRWKLGQPVGKGGFGLLYLANEDSSRSVGADASYVIKVEPSDNGPLFSELKFYMRAAKPDLIGAWMKSKKVDYLGVPKYWGSGFHEKGGKRYRFMVMDRFGTDLQKKFEENGRKFPRKLVLQLGIRLLDILEYIHEHEYVHADIKASNLLLSYTNPNQVYLVDYGLAYRYSPEGKPKEYKEDPKRCHDGTIEFTSIDAHKGVSPSRRADLEIMGYCMTQWVCGRLPWEDKLQDPLYVRDSKLRCRENIDEFMKSCFNPENKPDELGKFMQEVKSLGYMDKPDYAKLRSILQQGLKSMGASDDKKLDFTVSANGKSLPSVKKTLKRKKVEEKSQSNDETDETPAKKRPTPQKKEANRAKKPARTLKRPTKEKSEASSEPMAKKSRGRPKKNS
ncbi:serine/threonine-protein kinase VRK1 isoform X4 [Triplophysa rosa]|uniref:Serine/threonine-protein kinase VRK1 n=3 Tax=Triplophysa rosa TaxID=992332 RepID=A0A9W7TVD8_TRIRA|nr:serine/threonine-protein kinase VRK1 isoform X4 [Triplophysa rosa]XP_057199336.1 serine/threonine-protein kinase VRK1 isoform X4 [Triplophysa rosa]KAI7804297.1 serine/threonine-protein kinase VRK1 [Triplophysa rosa]